MFFWEGHVPGSNPWHQVKLDPKRGMHAEQEYVFLGRRRGRGRPRGEVAHRERVPQGGPARRAAEFAVMVTELRDEATGALVAEARMTGVETAKPPEAEG